ncbi:MAG: flagellar basal body P-ring formation chaperone FlgA [Immundisolibacter sp.]|uniref:flagellar basal body P-ring formation chaperone FlgA n=1 Tax=Immundisolibacter sp. TaxID=1934948 RepID=UPI003EE0C682
MKQAIMRVCWQFLALTALFASGAAQALQDPAKLVVAARDAALTAAREVGVNNPTATVARPDPRLRLADCLQPLTGRVTGTPRLPGRALVQVACEATPGWSIHLPVSVQAKAGVLVAARALPRGHRIKTGDLRQQTMELGALNGQYLLDQAQAQGQALRRSLGVGERLTPNVLQAPVLVRRGESVLMQLQGNNFVIQASGRALGNGAAGDRVDIENLHTKRVVHGTVTGDGRVTVEF